MASKPNKSKSLQRPAPRKPEAKAVKPDKGAKPARPAGKTASAVKSSAKDAGKSKDAAKSKDAVKPKDAAKSKDAAKGKNGAVKDAAKPKDAPKKKRKSSVVRLKAFWGIFNQMLKRVAVFEYADKKAADKKAAELSSGGKQPHFVQVVKEVIREGD